MTKLKGIKAVIFDWGRTLYDRDSNTEFREAEETLKYCRSKKLKMAAVSLAGEGFTAEERKEKIEKSRLRKYFEFVITTDFITHTDKDDILEKTVKNFGLPRPEILIVDDRTIRGVKYGNQHGHPTIWFRNGKFANELPNDETDQPTYTIEKLSELKKIL